MLEVWWTSLKEDCFNPPHATTSNPNFNTMPKCSIYDNKIAIIYVIYDWSWLHDFVVQKTLLHLPLVVNVVAIVTTICDYVFYDNNFFEYK